MANVFITGVNRGVGLALATVYARRGDRVIGATRDRAFDGGGVCERVVSLDVTRDVDIQALSETLKGESIDVLIHNAGVLKRNALDDLNVESIRHQFEVNALGPLRVTAALRTHLFKGSKVCIVSSRMGSVADNTSGGHYGYRMSKSAANMVGKSLSADLQPLGIAVRILHPGYVKTGMTGFRGNWGPDAAASALVQRIDDLTLESTGEFWHAEGHPLPW